jgi:hypothetical protein
LDESYFGSDDDKASGDSDGDVSLDVVSLSGVASADADALAVPNREVSAASRPLFRADFFVLIVEDMFRLFSEDVHIPKVDTGMKDVLSDAVISLLM